MNFPTLQQLDYTNRKTNLTKTSTESVKYKRKTQWNNRNIILHLCKIKDWWEVYSQSYQWSHKSIDSYASCLEETDSGGARTKGVTVDLRDSGPSELILLHNE